MQIKLNNQCFMAGKKLRMVMAALALKEGDDRAKSFLKRKSEFVPDPQI